MASVNKKVIVLGGGVAGMSAAHELVERGFQVEVYESKPVPGGKARSIPVPGSGKDGRYDLPGEHGFRFFPRFYRHLPDTMKRIPFGNNRNGVFDNLVETTRIDITQFDKPALVLLAKSPQSLAELEYLLQVIFEDTDNIMELKPGELSFFSERLWQILTSCEARRQDEYERLSWWDYLECDRMSEGFQKFLAQGLTRSLVAANAKVANTKVEGDIGLQLIMDMLTPGISSDRVLNGPTSDVWIDPWLKYLTDKGVKYCTDAKVVRFRLEKGQVAAAVIAQPDGTEYEVTGDYYVAALPVEVMARIIQNDPEQAILKADPSLAGIIPLSQYVAWMNGLQFFIKQDVPVIHGHVVYIDSPWAITSISQRQFWPHLDFSQYGDGTVQGVLSIDISDWNAPGILYGKPAVECTRQEIMQETWAQMKRSLNVNGQTVLSDDNIHSWFLDPDITDEHDLTTPTLYENAEPLLIALVNTWHLRPDAYTRIPNLFLASDYIRTYMQLATMEGANEAARRAVNSIIDCSGAKVPRCKVWRLQEPGILAPLRWYDRRRYDRGEPWDKDFPPWVMAIYRLVQLAFRARAGVTRAAARTFGSPGYRVHAKPQAVARQFGVKP
jgi:15-cis-phytoene desaturase